MFRCRKCSPKLQNPKRHTFARYIHTHFVIHQRQRQLLEAIEVATTALENVYEAVSTLSFVPRTARTGYILRSAAAMSLSQMGPVQRSGIESN